jgi:hypothetical protein
VSDDVCCSVSGRIGLPPWRRSIQALPHTLSPPTFQSDFVETEWLRICQNENRESKETRFNHLMIGILRARDHSPVFGSSCISICKFLKPKPLPLDLFPTFSSAVSVASPWLRHCFALVHSVIAPSPCLSSSGNICALKRYSLLDIPEEIKIAAGRPEVARFSSAKFLGFPDRWFVEWDCGKLRVLARLLSKLHAGGHKCIIFTQMSKMIDVLEFFVNLHGYTYVRLDGGTRVDRRQQIVDQFNTSPKLFLFIASTRYRHLLRLRLESGDG